MRTVRRVGLITLMGLALGMLARHAYGQDAVTLRYKYRAGELLRYKMVIDAKVQVTAQANGPSITMPVKLAGVLKQRTKRVLPDGNAEIVVAVESLRMEFMGETRDLPTKQLPAITLSVSTSGEVESMASKDLFGSVVPGGQLMGTSGMGHSVMLPRQELRVGDTWTQDIPKMEGLGNLRMSGKLLSTDFKVGKYTTAAFKQYIGGDVDMAVPTALNAQGGPIGPLGGNVKGSFLGDSTVCFSTERGQLIRTDGQMDMQMTASMPAENGGPGELAAQVQLSYQMFLLSAGTAK